MKRAIICSISCLLILSFIDEIIRVNKNSVKENIFYHEATVISLGQCNNEGCSVTLKDNKTSEIKYSISSEPVSIGRIMYKMCWYSKAEGYMCYVNYSLNKKTK